MQKPKDYKEKTLMLLQISINKDNYRFEFLKTTNQVHFKNESEIIEYFCCDEQGADMLKLIKSINNKGYLPNEKLSVFQNENNQYEVLDGNRRLTALKILNDPNLVPEKSHKIKKYCNEHQQTRVDVEVIEYFDKNKAYQNIRITDNEVNKKQKWDPWTKNFNDYKNLNKPLPSLDNVIYANCDKTFLPSLTKKYAILETIFTKTNFKYIMPINETNYQFINDVGRLIFQRVLQDIKENKINTRHLLDGRSNDETNQKTYLNQIHKEITNNTNKNYTTETNIEANNLTQVYSETEHNQPENNAKNIKENKYTIGDIEYKDPKLKENRYQGIIRIIKEIKILKYHSDFDNENKKTQIYKMLPIATLSLIRNLCEQVFKFYLKEYKTDEFKSLSKKNNKTEKNIKLSSIIQKITNTINNKKIIFNPNIDSQFRSFYNNLDNNEFLNQIVHQPHLYTGNIAKVEEYTSGYMYEILNFILNPKD